MSTQSASTLDKIVSLCKRRGFVYQSAEIYGGLNGVYDFGHLGTLMKQNIRLLGAIDYNKLERYCSLFEGSILGPNHVWKASGHVENFQ